MTKLNSVILSAILTAAGTTPTRAVAQIAPDSISSCDSIISDAAIESNIAISGVKRPHDDLYQYPYSMWRSCPNWPRLWENTAVLFAAGFVTLGVLELLPENTTAWNKNDHTPFFRRWEKHFKAGPVWDSDLPVFNYILHPYAGASYYMGARSQGFNVLGSALYSFCISTFFWEYGIECFNEVPSIQDLIITPIGGMVLGEAFYMAKRRIVENDYRLLGSPVLGNAVAIIVDPVNEVLGFIFGNSARQWIKYRKKTAAQVSSQWGPVTVGRSSGWGLSVAATF